MADFQVKICEKFNIKSLTDNQSKSITAIIDGKYVFVGTKRSVQGGAGSCVSIHIIVLTVNITFLFLITCRRLYISQVQ
jgi:hypothetical protein